MISHQSPPDLWHFHAIYKHWRRSKNKRLEFGHPSSLSSAPTNSLPSSLRPFMQHPQFHLTHLYFLLSRRSTSAAWSRSSTLIMSGSLYTCRVETQISHLMLFIYCKWRTHVGLFASCSFPHSTKLSWDPPSSSQHHDSNRFAIREGISSCLVDSGLPFSHTCLKHNPSYLFLPSFGITEHAIRVTLAVHLYAKIQTFHMQAARQNLSNAGSSPLVD